MAGKRTATSDLNHTNWDVEDSAEESGNFSKAPEDVIKNRVIKIAKRRNPIGSLASSDEEKKSTFANFGGFAKLPTAAPTSPFSFLSNLTNKTEELPKSNGLNSTSTTFKTSNATTKLPEKSVVMSTETQSDNLGKPKDYYAKIKGLNQSVSKWIQKHVDTNPFLNLTPVFRDYEKYLEEIETLNVQSDSHKIREINSATTKPLNLSEENVLSKSDDVTFAFGPSSSSTPQSNMFTFGKVNPESAAYNFSGSKSIATTKPFTFSNVTQEPEKTEQLNEEDEPPKVEFTPVIEEGHIYTVRCKVFVKKDDTFGDRGVGNLFLKPIPDSDKVQLIVRADTNLGNLSCNLILSKSIPIQRLGNKDVMLVCLPTPEHKPPPVPVLFRVKSSEQADELLKILEKHKK